MIAILTTILCAAVLVGLARARVLSRGQLRGGGLRDPVPALRIRERPRRSRAA